MGALTTKQILECKRHIGAGQPLCQVAAEYGVSLDALLRNLLRYERLREKLRLSRFDEARPESWPKFHRSHREVRAMLKKHPRVHRAPRDIVLQILREWDADEPPYANDLVEATGLSRRVVAACLSSLSRAEVIRMVGKGRSRPIELLAQEVV